MENCPNCNYKSIKYLDDGKTLYCWNCQHTWKESDLNLIPFNRYESTLLSLKDKFIEIKNSKNENERNYYIGIALKMIREEIYLQSL